MFGGVGVVCLEGELRVLMKVVVMFLMICICDNDEGGPAWFVSGGRGMVILEDEGVTGPVFWFAEWLVG